MREVVKLPIGAGNFQDTRKGKTAVRARLSGRVTKRTCNT